jgi:hypothetical protein
MSADTPRIRVGETYRDRENPDADLLLVAITSAIASEYDVVDGDTVADFNPEYPADDLVVECVYLTEQVTSRTTDIDDLKRYAFPVSRLAAGHLDGMRLYEVEQLDEANVVARVDALPGEATNRGLYSREALLEALDHLDEDTGPVWLYLDPDEYPLVISDGTRAGTIGVAPRVRDDDGGDR